LQAIIELNNVTFGYGEQPVLENIDLHLHAGQFAAMVGPSGAGKTSLLKLILGTLQPTSGRVLLQGKHGKLRIGYVPQLEDVDWNFPVTVEQAVFMGRIRQFNLWPWPTASDKAAMHEVLERLEIADLAQKHIRNLSGGQQQRVFLARALISQPDILVLDEPTTGVDLRTAENVLHLLADFNHQGITILMTTHDLNMAAAHIPWIICLNRQVIAQGTPEAVFTPEILNQTYRADMLVIHQDGMLFVQQKPHLHTYHDILPNPVLGHSES